MKRTISLDVKVTAETKASLEEWAADAGMTVEAILESLVMHGRRDYAAFWDCVESNEDFDQEAELARIEGRSSG